MLEDNKDSDYIFSLGDSEMPEHELSALNIVGVKGNYPFEPKFSYNLFLNFLGVDVFFTHGHRYNVKLGISRLLEEAKSLNAEIVCFGHTHQAYLRDVSGIIFLNPGSLKKPKYGFKPSYAIINISKEKIHIEIIELVTLKKIKEIIKKR